ncbi:hypothetical protein OGW18_20765 [Citrobacter sp. CK184]|uniref:hypothetical protein n=1 Tax=unclassified Citrobacter TaxID=2644389 RepID=UPI0025778198|nr:MULTISPECIES: hypothetical protein [unclassified Citrobacter]MDM3030199.1 hypothetical protein [Citrobacter sp. CK185]MDM3048733.1 hypothetical protein [Citrobacter sp. CK184]
MSNIEKLAKENGMTVEFVNWFFETKKDGCGNAWFMMMAAMWEGWKSQEARCRALAAENAGLNKFIAESCFVQAGEVPSWHQAIDHAPETPATDAFLAEVRAQGVESYAEQLNSEAERANETGWDGAAKFLRSELEKVREFAAQLRQGGAA